MMTTKLDVCARKGLPSACSPVPDVLQGGVEPPAWRWLFAAQQSRTASDILWCSAAFFRDFEVHSHVNLVVYHQSELMLG